MQWNIYANNTHSFSRKLNLFLAKGFVNKSASCNSVPINLISQVPFVICSLRKWCLISICLVLECITRFLDKFMALLLSKWIGILFKKIPKWLSCCLSHSVWAQQLPVAMYSASFSWFPENQPVVFTIQPVLFISS